MKVCFLAPALPAEDPGDAAGRHVGALAAAGHDVVLGLTDARPPSEGRLGDARVLAVEDVLGDAFDVAVALSWEATVRLFEVDTERFAYWVDGFGHHRLGSWQAERIAAAISYDLPVDFLCAAPWVERVLAEQRPDARRTIVRGGLDRSVFAPPARRTSRATPYSAQSGMFGVQLSVLVDDRWEAEPQGGEDRIGSSDDARARAAKYAQADVLVMLNAVDGVLGSPLEAMACGVVPVVLPAGGQEDLVSHLENGIVATPEDDRGVERWIERLDADRELLERLRTNALAAAGTWPTPEDAASALEAALEQIVAEPPPDAARWPVRLMADAMAGVAVYRRDHFVLAGELRRVEHDAAYQAAQRARAVWRRPKLAPVRKAARPLMRAAKKRLK